MMPINRLIIGSVAAAGAAYYVYQSQNSRPLVKEGTGQQIGRKVDEKIAQTKDGLVEVKDQANQKIDESLQSINQSKANANFWVSDKFNEAGKKAQEKATSFQAEKGTFDSLKDSFANAKNVTDEKISTIKDKVIADVNETKGWFAKNNEQLTNQAQNTLQAAKQQTDAYYDSIQSTASDIKSSISSWTNSAATEEALNKIHQDSKALVDDAQKKVNETKLGWFNKDEEKKRINDEAKKQLELAKSKFKAAGDDLKKFKDEARKALGNDSNSFYNWLRGYESKPITTRVEEVKDQAKDLVPEVPNPNNSWDKWANKRYEHTAQGAQEFFNDAQEALKDAQAKSNKWFTTVSSKSRKENLEEAQKRFDKASQDLKQWSSGAISDINVKFWSETDNAIDQTKKGIDSAADKAKQNLNSAQNWVKDQKS